MADDNNTHLVNGNDGKAEAHNGQTLLLLAAIVGALVVLKFVVDFFSG